MTRIYQNKSLSDWQDEAVMKIARTHYEPDGSIWMHILHHGKPSTHLFSKSDDFTKFVYKNEYLWADLSYVNGVSILPYEFLWIEKEISGGSVRKYRWSQSANPWTATWYDVESINKANNYLAPSGGLYEYTEGSNACWVNRNSVKGNWYGATGCWTAWQGGIPGISGDSGGKAVTTGSVDLYIRIN